MLLQLSPVWTGRIASHMKPVWPASQCAGPAAGLTPQSTPQEAAAFCAEHAFSRLPCQPLLPAVGRLVLAQFGFVEARGAYFQRLVQNDGLATGAQPAVVPKTPQLAGL